LPAAITATSTGNAAMPTFPETAAGPFFESRATTSDPRFDLRRIIALALSLVAAVLLLGACSAARLAYNQAPTVTYWWLDGYVDFTDAQSPQARTDIDRFFAWHRSAELPLYAQRLAQWQGLAQKDISAEQACSEADALRASFNRMSERGVVPLTALALQLTPAQLDHMQRHQTKGDESFAKDFLRGNPAQRLDNRLDRAINRYETLYGTLTDPQRQQLKTGLQQSSWDPQRTQTERQRRQTAMLKTIREVQAAHSAAFVASGSRNPPPEAVNALRSWSQRLQNSPTPGYPAYSAALVKDGCAQFATLHNSTSPEQRAHAVGVLKGYEGDMRALAAQD
jgi:hypothetical protein